MKGSSLRGVVLALCAGVFWGLSGTVGQYLFTRKGVDAGVLTVIRMLGAGVVLLGLAAAKHDAGLTAVWKKKNDAVRLVLFSLCGLMTVQYTYMAAIAHSNSGTATALQYLGQAFILLATCVMYRCLPRARELGGLGLATVGALLLVTHGRPGALAITPAALMWGLSSAAAVMVYTLSPGHLMADYGSRVVTGYGMLLGGAVLCLIVRPWRIGLTLDGQTLAALALIVLVGTAAAFAMYLQAVSDIGGVRTGLLSCTEMLSAPLISHFWLGTDFTVPDLAGFVFMVAMVFLLSAPAKKKAAA